MENSKCEKLWPGGNTTQGFYSYFDYIVKPNAHRLFILKGGPGVGKSSFMRKIGTEMRERGYSIEEHYCSSSIDSLDAVVIKELNVALVDGTSPHTMDPKYPGAVDEIVNLGDFLNTDLLEKNKDKSIRSSKEVNKCFKRAYRYLSTLVPFIQDISEIYQDCLDENRYVQMVENLHNKLFKDVKKRYGVGKMRHLFGSAITPQGHIDYQETVFSDINHIIYIKGNWGTGWEQLLEDTAKVACRLGYDVRVFHSPFAPTFIEDLAIPDLDIAMTTKEKFREQSSLVLDLDAFADEDQLNQHKRELDYDQKMFDELLDKSIAYINKAKISHDHLESFYIPAMDFDAVNKKRKEIVQRILKYA